MTGLIIGIIFAGVGLIIASTRKGSSVIGLRTKRIQSFTALCNSEEALKAIISFAKQSGYKVAALNETKGQAVLEKSVSVFSWGFFFPLFVSQQSDGSTLVEVGIKSKLFQGGPIVTRNHVKCVNGMKAILSEQR